ncbi:VanZ family protein [Thauera chlorobenzoica]|uniref:Membrane protein n=1 Tax=Thauera chlorobenzoica TaxID=96773 RepID=A0A1H5W091_9RHOO|nr:VanZ family protein [Thauera chlorobenzoica]APR03315.1 membrane protein [Thauera chlorobenzoica]SEF92932.1 VanZ like family protein [Thauera chlorobenzoica]
MSARSSASFARTLAPAYALLVAYACLHPLTGWRDSGLPALDYLWAPWPQYFIAEDFVFNILGYLPLGFLLAAALPARWSAARAAATATVLAGLLSLGLETLQNFLPSRIASNLDLGGNVAGAFLGALAGARWGAILFGPQGRLQRWRAHAVIGGRTGELGLVLIGLWLLGQLTATSLLFSSGDLRSLLGIPAPLPFRAERFIAFDTALTASALLAVGLFARCLTRGANPLPVLLVLILGVAAKTLATATFFEPGAPLAWLTPGARHGLVIGLALLLPCLLLPRLAQHALAGTSLLAATALANLIPENPYLPYDRQLTGFSNFLNFHGLTRLSSSLWPFAALAYLSALGLWRGEHLGSPSPRSGRRL